MTDRIGRSSAQMTIMQGFGFAATAALYVFLGRKLGPSDYGIAGIIMSALTSIRTGVFGSLMLATAKTIAAQPTQMRSCLAVSRRVFAGAALALAGVFLGLGPYLAELLNDPLLTPYLRLVSVAIPPIAALVLLQATLVGLRDFRSNMLLGMLFQLLKLLCVAVLVLLGAKIVGLIAGFAIAAIIPFVLFRSKGRISDGSAPLTLRSYMTTAGGLFFIVTLAVVQRYVNLLNLKRLALSSHSVGYYTAAAQLASVPALVFGGFAIALWPTISASATASNLELARRQLRKSLRYLMISLMPLAAILWALPDRIMVLAFGSDYAPAADILHILVTPMLLIAVQSLILAAIMAAGRSRTASCIVAASIVIALLAGNVLIPRLGATGAAIAELIGLGASCLLLGVLARRVFGPFLSPSQTCKVVATAAAGMLAIRSFAFLGHSVAIVALITLPLYLVTLNLLGVVESGELRRGLAFFARRSDGGRDPWPDADAAERSPDT